MISILEKLFGSSSRVKIMRLFLFNPSETFDMRQIQERSKVTAVHANQEIVMMRKIGLIKKRSFFKDYLVGKKKNKKTVRRRTEGFTVDTEFDYLQPLQNLLIHISPLRDKEIMRRISRVGKIRLVIVSGVFINNWDTRVDLLVVGDNIRKSSLDNAVKTIESEIGREIRYAWFETPDFKYRLGIYDKLVRDILDYPHEKIMDKLDVENGR